MKAPRSPLTPARLLLAALLSGVPVQALAQDPPAEATTENATPMPEPVPLDPNVVNQAEFDGQPFPEKKRSPIVLKLQVLLDRAGLSPGVIDGIMGDNVVKAIVAAEATAGLPQDGVLDADVWQALTAAQDQPVLTVYEVTAEDVAGPFVPDLPSDYGKLAKLKRSAFRTAREMFAERFHMDEDLLAALNPDADFGRRGTMLVVAAPGQPRRDAPVSYVIADKTRKQVLGYDAENRLIVSYPATIGSAALPSPSGIHAVNAIATDAAYYYRPDVNFQQGNNTRKLTIPPGPNNPIGTTWIDLTEPTYGIHGTPEPSRIDKTNSHGCIRLTNWDAEELAGLVKKGVTVEFR